MSKLAHYAKKAMQTHWNTSTALHISAYLIGRLSLLSVMRLIEKES